MRDWIILRRMRYCWKSRKGVEERENQKQKDARTTGDRKMNILKLQEKKDEFQHDLGGLQKRV